MNSSIFRQVSLDRLSSPEQLDQLLVITGARTWFGLAAVMALIAAACVWGFLGSVTTTAAGTGVIVREGGVLNVVSNGGGVVTSISAVPGTIVRAHQLIATIQQPQLLQQIALLERARNEAIMMRDNRLKVDQRTATLKEQSNIRERANVQAEISELQGRAGLTEKQIAVEEQLFSKGLVTNQQVLDMKQKLATINDDIAADNAKLVRFDAERFAIDTQPQQNSIESQMHVTDLERQIASANEKLRVAENVESPYDGEVLEVKVSPGSTVLEGQPIVSIQPRQQNLEILAYLPSLLAKDVHVGMDAEVSPSNIKREEYGFIRGRVDFIADFPATNAAMMHNFENNTLVQALTESGPVTEIRASLTTSPKNVSGFEWSTSAGPTMIITSGTICSVDVVTKRERPVSLLFPYLHLR